ncbi:LacI family DNA-binding transcriptional regulator [Actinotalea sp. Marseille-Q4924]|uniref:LacI family DNA-binding transcriptional regulator n=1 Tax=Actinotalea sp. Marseille-Q4924 TaxID=2866571 RepID=UPI001CE3DA2F|nr:LacI family DNA-binding transcriptional regulator [Actinotalea sp. Marseille-Q4924]
MGNRTTVRDVAAAAGVSPATASRALSGHPSVAPELARRVTEASARLGYRANPLARALRTRRTDTIGMVVPSISNPYFVGAVEAIEKVLAVEGRSLMICDAGDDVEVEAARIELLVDRMVDGLVVVPVSAEASGPGLRAAADRVAVVQLDRVVDSAGTDFVGLDNSEGMRKCLEHLRAQGRRSIVYVGARPSSSTARDRLVAYRELASASERHPIGELLGNFTMAWGVEAARRLLAAPRLPDAVVCGADVIAVAVLSTLRQAGIGIPDQVQLISFDDSELGRMTVPPLTSVRQPIDSMAREAVRLLGHRRLHPEAPLRKSIFLPELMVRDSTTSVSHSPA